jgi:hypothetical protein
MIKNPLIIATLLFFFSIIDVTAQSGYGDPYNVNNGYGPTGYGRRRNTPMKESGNLSKAEQEIISEETIRKTVEKFKRDLSLDELQLIVITKVITDNQKKRNVIITKDDSQENKIAEVDALMESTEREIMGFLNKDQKEKYKLLIDERKNRFEKLKK